MKIGTLFGEYPFQFEHAERRRGELVVVGTVAGIKSNLIVERQDLDIAVRALSGLALALFARRSLRRRRRSLAT